MTNDRFRTDKIYFTDELIGHHLVWHNPYIALALHPDWPKAKPYPDQPDFLSDNISWAAYIHVVSKMGISIGTPIFVFRYGLLDRIIRSEFLTFIMSHPRYTMELYFYYKATGFIQTLSALIKTIPLIAWLASVVSCMLAALLFVSWPPSRRATIFYTILIAWASSLLPAFWAYSASHVFADQLWSSLFLIFLIASALLSCALKTLHKN